MLPSGHAIFGVPTLGFATVAVVRTADVGGGQDPLTGALTQVLTVPLRELYAALWRLGVIDVVGESSR
ncbi:hypothetical protein A5780_02455 [Nocardia sp. 852002-20019_SCH5090214]|jgi:hypothetical protein|nr:hypothetical protein A5780_02455 [Nocardia sp. 852002-20019_SCH5090214]OBA54830.1 hypothetical protein A5789_21425 [Nocardia sp. 852002-51101_SCH5132738]OBB48731.1 hypothetical protein A5748_21330 [Nocardia sp. 852002-51244_SCH5132740]OBF85730.1 hypothetical protein A9X06_13110 [Mycobacterium sp. 852002-51759_SCH5129042]